MSGFPDPAKPTIASWPQLPGPKQHLVLAGAGEMFAASADEAASTMERGIVGATDRAPFRRRGPTALDQLLRESQEPSQAKYAIVI